MQSNTRVYKNWSDEQVLAVIHEWIDALAAQDYEGVFSALGYALAFGEPGAGCIRQSVEGYRSPDFYPGVEQFAVTDWRTARGGNPEPTRTVTWYKPNSTGLVGAAAIDLPLNGRWSDLTADFVWFDTGLPDGGFQLSLEEVSSVRQLQREQEERDALVSNSTLPRS
jgi:hypothetical protein